MTRLSDTQLVILSAAAQRADLSVLPLPDSLTLKGGALNKVMDSLRNRGLIRVLGGDGGPERVIITSEGMAAIGVEADHDETLAPPDTAPTSANADSVAEGPAPAMEADGAATPAKRKPAKGKAKASRAAPATSERTSKPTECAHARLAQATGYRLYPPDSPEAGALLAEQGLGPADLERALARLETTEDTAIRTIVGVNEDGVFGFPCQRFADGLTTAHA